MSTAPERHFLGWDHPALDSAARWMVHSHALSGSELDLGDVRVVVPGSRAARMLLGNLVDLCVQHQVVLIPPIILTPRELPAALLGIPGHHASKLTQRLAWVQALQACDQAMICDLIPEPPLPEQWELWAGIGSWIAGVSSMLCDAGIRMGGVIDRAGSVLEENELKRWVVLGRVEQNYEQVLADLGVIDEHLAAIDRVQDTNASIPVDTRLVLVGLPELGSIARGAIERTGCRVDALVYAPSSMADRFDELGCIVPDAWSRFEPEIVESRIVFTHDRASMCEQALTQLAMRAQPMSTDACVIGLADETLLGPLARKASMVGTTHGIELHTPSGSPALSTRPGQLLLLIQSHMREQTFDTLGELVRHPDFEGALTRAARSEDGSADDPESAASARPPAWWLRSLDRIRQDHVLTIADQIPPGTHEKFATDARFVQETVRSLLEELVAQDLPLNTWAIRVGGVLEGIYRGVELAPGSEHDRPVIEGLRAIRTVLDEIRAADQLGQTMPITSAHGAIGLVLSRLGEIRLPQLINRDAIETLGWLELMLDPAPVCVVIGMSEACIPGAVTHDPLLPSSLRDALGMSTNEDRLARDTYTITAINASRDAVFMCARHGDQNDPITPSRLLLKTSGKTLADRVRRFVNPSLDPATTHRLTIGSSPGTIDQFRGTLVVDDRFAPPTSMAVTDFDAYLRSPAAWYLQRQLKLDELDTSARELSAMHMGNLIHSIMDAFGKDESMRDLDDPEAINQAFEHLLETRVRSFFGSRPPAAVQVQTLLLRSRLGWFAQQQADRRQAGWRIAHTEWAPDPDALPELMVDHEPMEIRGKIDRIDFHEDGSIAIIDYKTGRETDARKAHLGRYGWKKLQLPLYRILAAPVICDRELSLGYAGLPASEGERAWSFAQWSSEELESADEAARVVVRSIRAMHEGLRVELGDSPPDSGILGFITGRRFEAGGHEAVVEPELTEPGVEGGS